MLKRYTFWLTAAVIFQFLTAAVHAISLFVKPEPADDTQRQLMTLMTTYKVDLGAGFHRTFADLVTALSSCFSLVCLLGGLTNGYLLLKHAEPSLMKGIIAINVVVFGICFAIMAYFTFLPPIVCTGLIFINLLAAFIVVPRIESTV